MLDRDMADLLGATLAQGASPRADAKWPEAAIVTAGKLTAAQQAAMLADLSSHVSGTATAAEPPWRPAA